LYQGDQLVAVAQTDEAGNFTFTDVEAGTYRLNVIGIDGYVPPLELTVGAGDTVTGLRLQIHQGGAIRGTLTGSGGPLAGFAVQLAEPDGNVTATVTDVAGMFAFIGLAPGAYRVGLQADGLAPAQDVTVSDIDGQSVVVDLTAAFT